MTEKERQTDRERERNRQRKREGESEMIPVCTYLVHEPIVGVAGDVQNRVVRGHRTATAGLGKSTPRLEVNITTEETRKAVSHLSGG